MGMMIEGRWSEKDDSLQNGGFERQPSRFDQELGQDVVQALQSAPERYHLIASLSCPWSHRTLLTRSLKGLEAQVPLQVAGGVRVEGYPANGGKLWRVPGTDREIQHLHELYALSDPRYSGRVTVPLLWDSREQKIISNESARILCFLDAAVAGAGHRDYTLRPCRLTAEIDALNRRLHDELSNAVYRAGLARCQELYEEAATQVFAMLDELEKRLATRRYLFGAVLTESDLHLLPTLLRFDSVYTTHFRCCRRRLTDYRNLWAYTRDLYAWRGVAATTDFQVIREGYYLNDGDHNPYGIVALQPEIDWMAPHGREALSDARLASRGEGSFAVDPATLRPIGRAE